LLFLSLKSNLGDELLLAVIDRSEGEHYYYSWHA